MENRQWLGFLSVLVMIFTLSGCGGGGGPGSANVVFNVPVISNTLKTEYLNAINVARGNNQNCGARGDFPATTALTWSSELYEAAYEHSHDMAESGTFDHSGSGTVYDITAQEKGLGHGSSPLERIENNGYLGLTGSGENIAAGTTTDTAQKVVNAWLASDGHCANLMNPDFKDVGMAHYEKTGSHFTHYWTQNFGSK